MTTFAILLATVAFVGYFLLCYYVRPRRAP
jgi:hypothetical protein